VLERRLSPEEREEHSKLALQLASQLEQDLDHVMQARHASNTRDYMVFHPSAVGKCLRKQVLQALVPSEGKEPFTSNTLRKFDNGHYYHSRLLEEMEEAGYVVKDELGLKNPEVNSGGHTDQLCLANIPGYGGLMFLVEAKSMNSRSFEDAKKNGISQDYKDQLMVYLHLTGLTVGIFVCENKDSQDRLYTPLIYDRNTALALIDKAKSFNENVANKTVPPIPQGLNPYTTSPGSSKECYYCGLKDLCRANVEGRWRVGDEVIKSINTPEEKSLAFLSKKAKKKV